MSGIPVALSKQSRNEPDDASKQRFYLVSCVVSPDDADERSRMLLKLQRLPRSVRETKPSKVECEIFWLHPS